MNIAEGVVSNIYQREVNTKNGPATAYSMKLSDGEFYSMGFKKPTVGAGDKIQLVYTTREKDGKVYRDAGDIEVIGKAEATAKVSTSTTPIKASKGDKDDYWTAKAVADAETSKRLDVVGSRNSAIQVVTACVELGILTMPKTKGKGFDAFLEAVAKTQEGFYLHPDNIASVKERAVEEAPVETLVEADFD